MGKSVVFYFSATGNSLFAAKYIADRMDAELLPITYDSPLELHYDRIGFVYPIYYGGMPGLVESFIQKVQIKEDPYIFAIATSGPMPGSSLGFLSAILREKKKLLHYCASVRSVANNICMYNIQKKNISRKADQSKELLDVIVQDIRGNIKNFPPRRTLFSFFFHRRYKKQYLHKEPHFSVLDSCKGCGICRRICPAGNIRQKQNKKPEFKSLCEHCLACVHGCPNEAIQWKDTTNGKTRYRHPEVGLTELYLRE